MQDSCAGMRYWCSGGCGRVLPPKAAKCDIPHALSLVMKTLGGHEPYAPVSMLADDFICGSSPVGSTRASTHHCMRKGRLAADKTTLKQTDQEQPEPINNTNANENQVSPRSFQIFIKTPMGNSILVWIHASAQGTDLKKTIGQTTGYPCLEQSLIYGGRALQDSDILKDYGIYHASTIHLNLGLREGVVG